MFILFTDLLSLSGLTSYTLLSTLILEEIGVDARTLFAFMTLRLSMDNDALLLQNLEDYAGTILNMQGLPTVSKYCELIFYLKWIGMIWLLQIILYCLVLISTREYQRLVHDWELHATEY